MHFGMRIGFCYAFMEQSSSLLRALTARRRNYGMAEIGEPERRRVLVPEETPTTPINPAEPKSPVKVPEREPA
jgi:hypothetical protein